MPEFQPNTSGSVADREPDTDIGEFSVAHWQWGDLDAFTQGYIEALFFTEGSPVWSKAAIAADPAQWEVDLAEGTADGVVPGDAGFADLASDALADIIADCAAFRQTEAWKAFDDWRSHCDGDEADDAQAGHDYWFTRNGHGVGFWDRPVTFYGTHADTLSNACRYASVDVYFGDDGKVYVS